MIPDEITKFWVVFRQPQVALHYKKLASVTFLRPGYVPRQIPLVASTRKEKMSARLKKSRGFECEWSGWVWFQSRAVISLIVPASFSLFSCSHV